MEHHEWDSIHVSVPPPHSEACFCFELGLDWEANLTTRAGYNLDANPDFDDHEPIALLLIYPSTLLLFLQVWILPSLLLVVYVWLLNRIFIKVDLPWPVDVRGKMYLDYG